MIGLEVLAILLLNSLVAGVVLGYFLRSIWDRIKKLEAKLAKQAPRTGATKGSYQTPAPVVQRDPNKSSGVVKPKTPQKLTWEADEERRKQSLEWGVGNTSQGLDK